MGISLQFGPAFKISILGTRGCHQCFIISDFKIFREGKRGYSVGRYRTSRKKDERENGGTGCRGTKMREKTGVQCGKIKTSRK